MATKGYKQRQEIDAALGAFNRAMSTDAIGSRFQGLQGLASPFLNQMAASQALAGQGQANAALANMGRMGLGGTGLGAALGAGLQAGSAFGGNQIRARMFQDLLGQASSQQGMIAQNQLQALLGKTGTYKDIWDRLPQIQALAGQIGQTVTGGMYGLGQSGGQGIGPEAIPSVNGVPTFLP